MVIFSRYNRVEMSLLVLCFSTLVLPVAAETLALEAALPAKTRLIIMADMGNEPDEEQQMAHMLMYSNMFDLEGLIACSGKYLHSAKTDGRTRMRPRAGAQCGVI